MRLYKDAHGTGHYLLTDNGKLITAPRKHEHCRTVVSCASHAKCLRAGLTLVANKYRSLA